MSLKPAPPTGAPHQSPNGALLPDRATIFLVDEDDAVRDALATSLQAAGHAVAAFGSARQFVDAYRQGHPGCLVVDMDLPDLGAVDLLRMLAAAEATIPAILTSRRLQRRTPVGALPPGRILFLDKPFGVDELLRLIRMALGRGSGRQSGR